jgi:hypothetical protein
MTHTKGKLTVRGDLVCDSSGNSLWDYHDKSPEENEADTRRLVACWNALDGVPTEWLENYVSGNAMWLKQRWERSYGDDVLVEEIVENLPTKFRGCRYIPLFK